MSWIRLVRNLSFLGFLLLLSGARVWAQSPPGCGSGWTCQDCPYVGGNGADGNPTCGYAGSGDDGFIMQQSTQTCSPTNQAANSDFVNWAGDTCDSLCVNYGGTANFVGPTGNGYCSAYCECAWSDGGDPPPM